MSRSGTAQNLTMPSAGPRTGLCGAGRSAQQGAGDDPGAADALHQPFVDRVAATHDGQPAARLEDHQIRVLHMAHTAASQQDRKSTRLNSSHVSISYAVFCLKKK